jgi:hypothetical protein
MKINKALLICGIIIISLLPYTTSDIIKISESNQFSDEEMISSYIGADGNFSNSAEYVEITVTATVLGTQCTLPDSLIPKGPPSDNGPSPPLYNETYPTESNSGNNNDNPNSGGKGTAPPSTGTGPSNGDEHGFKALLLQVEQIRTVCLTLETLSSQAASLGYQYIILWSNDTYDVGANLVTTLLYSPYWIPPNGTIGYFDVTSAVGQLLNDSESPKIAITYTQSPYQMRLLNNGRDEDSPIDSRITVMILATSCAVFVLIEILIQWYQAFHAKILIPSANRVFIIYTVLLLIFIETILDAWFDPYGIIVTTSVITTSIYCSMLIVQSLCYIIAFYLFLTAVAKQDHHDKLMKMKIPVYVVMITCCALVLLSKMTYYYTGIIVMTYVFFGITFVTLVVTNLIFIIYTALASKQNAFEQEKKNYNRVLLVLSVMMISTLNYLPVIGMTLQTLNMMSTVDRQVFFYNYSRYTGLANGFVLVFILAFCHWTQWLVFEANKDTILPMKMITSKSTNNKHGLTLVTKVSMIPTSPNSCSSPDSSADSARPFIV